MGDSVLPRCLNMREKRGEAEPEEPEADQGGLVATHDNPGVGASDEGAAQ